MTMLWHIEIEPAPGQADHIGERLALEAVELGSPARGRSAPAAAS